MSAPSRWQNLMIDIETMGHGPTAPVLAVGIVPFQIHPEQCSVAPRETWAEVRCGLAANVAGGRVIDPETVEWWLRQSKTAQEALLAEPRHSNLLGFWSTVREIVRRPQHAPQGDLLVWAKPPQYDLTAIWSSFEQLGIEPPWQRRNEMDLRTLLRAAKAALQSGQDGWQETLEVKCELEHSATADAAEQAEQVVRFYRRLYRR